jgi:hypothetical protein
MRRAGRRPLVANLLSDNQGHVATNDRPLVAFRNLIDCGLLPCHLFFFNLYFLFFIFYFLFFIYVMRKFRDGPSILEEWVYNIPTFWTLPLNLVR